MAKDTQRDGYACGYMLKDPQLLFEHDTHWTGPLAAQKT
jgi:hypothetical protein